jgi:uncharacterized protein DUF3604
MVDIAAGAARATKDVRTNWNLSGQQFRSRAALVLSALFFVQSAMAVEPDSNPAIAEQRNPIDVYWGDLHVHSNWSVDAGSFGNTSLGPDDAFRFARGEEITAHNGLKARLRRPLDFLLVSDHSEYLGLYAMLEESNPDLLATEYGQNWHALLRQGKRKQIGGEFVDHLGNNEQSIRNLPFNRSIWQRVIANGERYNNPGKFTAFIGYEWTSMPDGANLHRNILFRDGAELTSQVLPFSSIDSADPEELWQDLADYEQRTGGRVLAIPHNSNLSGGRMFELTRFDGRPMSTAYAEARTRWEPVVEATQIKGDSETTPFLSPNDEFADFGTWDQMGGLAGKPHTDSMYAGEYVRTALGNGLAIEQEVGANPFRFGLIGSTDSHTSLATADGNNFWGKFSTNEPHPGRVSELWTDIELPEDSPMQALLRSKQLPATLYTWSLVASGYAAVWAQENTRASLFEAIARRETYATTGPRMVVRLFGGFEFNAADAVAPDLAAVGYKKGVPMGGELSQPPRGRVPGFLVSALRDPEGANLDRVQIVKLWLDRDDKVQERIYDVAVSGGREIAEDGRCHTPVGSSVDIEAATYTNAIGDGALTAVWHDPDFDPGRRAVYYVRVIEIPTPRWTTYDAARYNEERVSRAPSTIQERAYTSPIWYSPPAKAGGG